MPTLLSLPVELHLMIIEKTDLYDLEALWTFCKTFYAYGEDKLRLHTYKKTNFHTIAVDWDTGSTNQVHPLLRLRDVLEDEEIGLYPRVMKMDSLEYWNPDEDDDDYPSLEIDKIIEEYGDRIHTMLADTHRKLLPNASIEEATAWSNDVAWEGPAPIIILLLTLYPHLEDLCIHDLCPAWWSVNIGLLFTFLTAAASDPTTNTLSRLSKITLTGGSRLADVLSPLMAVPTMRSIEAYDLKGRNVQWSRGLGSSQVKDLKLELCDIDTATLTSHIGAVKTLATLKYSFCPTKDEDKAGSHRWEPRAIVASLRLYACDTLTILELTAANLMETLPFHDDEPYIGSLRAFKVLRSVKLDTMMLYKQFEPASSVLFEPEQKDPRNHQKQARAQPLVNFLPASIQRFHMTSKTVGRCPSRKDVGAMFKGLSVLKTRYLPRLEAINLCRVQG